MQPRFAHHITSILLAELQNFEELAHRSVGNFLENTCEGKATSAFFQDVNLGLLVQAAWSFGSRIHDDSLRIRHGGGELRKRACCVNVILPENSRFPAVLHSVLVTFPDESSVPGVTPVGVDTSLYCLENSSKV